MKRIFSFTLCLLVIFSIYIPVTASSNPLVINFKIGSSKIHINNIQKTIESPYLQNKIVFVPLQIILEAYGAEVDLKVKNKVKLIYRDIDISFDIGSKKYVINQISKPFVVIPQIVNKVLMVPVEFITSNFGGKLSFNKNNSTYSLTLLDDGAITDFSTVIGSINKAKVGNSYFGWSLNIPKGSQLIDNSFNSKDISIGNEQRGIQIDISVDVDEGKKYQEFINEMKNSDGNTSKESSASGKVLDSSINTTSSLGYLEILTSDYASGGIIRRIYIKNGYVFKVTFASNKEVNPKKLKNDTYFMSLINSFNLGYKGNVLDVKDLSKIKDGMVKYLDPFYGFTMNVPPEWEVLDSNDSSDIPVNKIGLNKKEYISISPEFVESISDIDKYGDYLKELYSENFNNNFYKFIDKKSIDFINKKACKIVYSLENKGIKSIFDENLIIQGGIFYSITIKSPENIYSKKNNIYTKIFNSVTYSGKNADAVKKYIESNKTEEAMSRVGKDDKLVDFIDKDYNWKMKVPGSWVTVQYFQDNIKIFSDNRNQAYLGIETIENTSDTLKQDDKNIFETLKSIKDGKDNYTFISKETLNEKDTSIQVYKYRLDDEKTDTHGDAIHYIIHGEKYSYCFFYILQDIYTSEKNVSEITDIWNSFKTN